MTSGYLFVVCHSGMGPNDRRIGCSRFHPLDLVARWEKARGSAGTMKLCSMAFVSDTAKAFEALAQGLRGAGTSYARPRPTRFDCVPRGEVKTVMAQAIEADHQSMRAAFDPSTRLFQDPARRLDGPPARLVREVATQLSPFGTEADSNLFLSPYCIGLIWSLIDRRANQLAIPAQFIPEIYRAVAAAIWGRRPSDRDLADIRTILRRRPADLRIARFEFVRFLQAPISRNPFDPDALARLRDFVSDPVRHRAAGFDAYARAIHGGRPVRWASRALHLMRASVLAVFGLGLEILAMGGGEDALMRVILAGFLAGLVLFRMGLFGQADTPRLLGHVSLQDWRDLRGDAGPGDGLEHRTDTKQSPGDSRFRAGAAPRHHGLHPEPARAMGRWSPPSA